MTDDNTFKSWCLVELFGHQKIAGMCSEQNIAGTNMLRVDVPETKQNPKFTKFFGSSSIYAITPIDEDTCLMYAKSINVAPIESWEASKMVQLRLENNDCEHEEF